MRVKLVFSVIFFQFALFISLKSQQLPVFTQHREYYGYINPASINIDYFKDKSFERFHAVGVSHRRQWLASEIFSINNSVVRYELISPISNGNFKIVAGGYLLDDQIAITSFTAAFLRGGIFIGNGENSSLFGVGFTAGGIRHSMDTNDVYAESSNDNALGFQEFEKTSFDIGVGIFGVLDLNNDMYLYGGASIPQVTQQELLFKGEVESEFNFQKDRHYFMQLGYYLKTPSPIINQDYSFIDFSVWLKKVDAIPLHADFNFRYQIIQHLWLGVGYGTSRSLHLETGTIIQTKNKTYFRLGLGYTTPFSVRYGPYVGDTFEINLSAIIKK